MGKKYNLKLSPIIKKIVDLYIDFAPINRGNTAAAYLRPAIHETVNRMLDFLKDELEHNEDLQKALKKEENKEIANLIDLDQRF
jgi:predicted DNA-binding protein